MLVNCFLNEKAAVGCSVATLTFYRSSVNRFYSYLADIRSDLEHFDKSTYFGYLFSLRSSGLSSVSIQSYIRGLKCFFSWAYTSGYLDCDFNSFCVLPKAPRPAIIPLLDLEISALYRSFKSDFCGRRNRAILSLFLGSGIRLGEALAPFSSLYLSEGFLLVHGKGIIGDRMKWINNFKKNLSSLLFWKAWPCCYIFLVIIGFICEVLLL